MKKKTFLATLNGQKLQNTIFLLQVLPTSPEKIMKVNNFKEEVGQRVFFSKGYFFQDLTLWQSKCAYASRFGQNPLFIKFIENLCINPFSTTKVLCNYNQQSHKLKSCQIF